MARRSLDFPASFKVAMSGCAILSNWLSRRTGPTSTRPWVITHTRSCSITYATPTVALLKKIRSRCPRTASTAASTLAWSRVNQEPLYASFEVNRREGAHQPWYFKGWFRKGSRELTRFPYLPEMAQYFDDPSTLVFDARRDFRINIDHILSETPRERFPEPYASMEAYALQTVVKGVIDNARERVRRSYKTAIPQYYFGKVQLLLPLCLSNSSRADLAMVVERHSTFYRASTCLTLDMAYNNARQLARPDRDWLQP